MHIEMAIAFGIWTKNTIFPDGELYYSKTLICLFVSLIFLSHFIMYVNNTEARQNFVVQNGAFMTARMLFNIYLYIQHKNFNGDQRWWENRLDVHGRWKRQFRYWLCPQLRPILCVHTILSSCQPSSRSLSLSIAALLFMLKCLSSVTHTHSHTLYLVTL